MTAPSDAYDTPNSVEAGETVTKQPTNGEVADEEEESDDYDTEDEEEEEEAEVQVEGEDSNEDSDEDDDGGTSLTALLLGNPNALPKQSPKTTVPNNKRPAEDDADENTAKKAKA